MMSQSSMRSCPNCRSSVPTNMRFCPNCGAPAEARVDSTVKAAPGAGNYAPAPPPYAGYPPQQQQPSVQNVQPPPAYAKPQKDSSKGVLGQIGCGVGVVLLLVLLVLGTAGYFVYRYIGSHVTNGPSSNAATSTQAPIVTTQINETVTYASVKITILNAQQATTFADDNGTAAPGTVRLNIHAVQSAVSDTNGGSNVDQYYDYPSSFTLILPGGNKVALVGSKDTNGPTKKGNQTTWVDFPVPTSIKVTQLVLRIGKDTEEQMDIPLTGHADLSKYQAKVIQPNVKVQYGGMFWTLTTASAQLSDAGVQADKGKRFIVLTLKIDNPSSQNTNGYPPDYIRLQSGTLTIPETADTIPTPAAGTSNAVGLVAFLMPQESTAFTLILLPNVLTGATSQASIPFQF